MPARNKLPVYLNKNISNLLSIVFLTKKLSSICYKKYEEKMLHSEFMSILFMQLLKSPSLRSLHICSGFLTKCETDELLALVQDRLILQSVVHFFWNNWYYPGKHLEPWMADEDHFELLLNMLEVAYPQMELIRGNIQSTHILFFVL
jgi:hypothetical protein